MPNQNGVVASFSNSRHHNSAAINNDDNDDDETTTTTTTTTNTTRNSSMINRTNAQSHEHCLNDSELRHQAGKCFECDSNSS